MDPKKGPLLSVLIASLIKRRESRQELIKFIAAQDKYGKIEILVNEDNGKKKIGLKRNELLDQAKGDYIVFVDDDDWVARNYIPSILKAIQSRPDCCSLRGRITIDGKKPRTFLHSIRYKRWGESRGVYLRCPNHLNVVKREIAVKVRFPEINFGEDSSYSERLLPFLKSESKIESVLYWYRKIQR